MELQDVNLADAQLWGSGRHWEALRTLRRQAPVWRHPDPGGVGPWVLTRHRHIVHVSREWGSFSSERDRGGVSGFLSNTREGAKLAVSHPRFGHMFVEMDPPTHGKFRRAILPKFGPAAVRRLEDKVREIAERLVAEVVEQGEVDFVRALATELPLQVVAELMGVPAEDRAALFVHVMATDGAGDVEIQQRIDSFDALRAYSKKMVAARRTTPTDDAMGLLARAEVDGEPISELDQQAQFSMMWSAGAETTRATMTAAMTAFAADPGAYTEIAENPELLRGSALEEMLRWASPIVSFRRNAVTDVELDGQVIEAGETVAMYYPSANRDEETFESPDTFDIHRDPNPHLAFGGGGPHFCVGAPIARMQVRVLFEELTKRVRSVELVGKPRRAAKANVNSIVELPVRLRPALAHRS
ncbi:cytochrome P450 [Pseudonocardia ailaonensis]|uniref:Cytochrome P450 n=1 Tax=Pseudonocardia ailaonensis TaxID=367279 RepID=A0ABN2NGU5_9PSEU